MEIKEIKEFKTGRHARGCEKSVGKCA